MKIYRQRIRSGFMFCAATIAGATSVFAQGDILPAYAYDRVAEISMATTAGDICDGAVVNDRRLQKAMLDLMGQLSADGLDPVASVQQLSTEAAQAQFQQRATDLRARHGVAPEGDSALCDAIRAEVKISKSLARMIKFR